MKRYVEVYNNLKFIVQVYKECCDNMRKTIFSTHCLASRFVVKGDHVQNLLLFDKCAIALYPAGAKRRGTLFKESTLFTSTPEYLVQHRKKQNRYTNKSDSTSILKS